MNLATRALLVENIDLLRDRLDRVRMRQRDAESEARTNGAEAERLAKLIEELTEDLNVAPISNPTEGLPDA